MIRISLSIKSELKTHLVFTATSADLTAPTTLPENSKGEPGLEQKVVKHYITFSSEKAATVVRKAKENKHCRNKRRLGKVTTKDEEKIRTDREFGQSNF